MTLLELLIVIAIIGSLVIVTYPIYTNHILVSHRTVAINDLMRIQLQLEQNYDTEYNTTGVIEDGVCILCLSDPQRYKFSVSLQQTQGYKIRAIPIIIKGQNRDKCADNYYLELSLDHTGEGQPRSCWP